MVSKDKRCLWDAFLRDSTPSKGRLSGTVNQQNAGEDMAEVGQNLSQVRYLFEES